jgi:anti-anti-sigma factor
VVVRSADGGRSALFVSGVGGAQAVVRRSGVQFEDFVARVREPLRFDRDQGSALVLHAVGEVDLATRELFEEGLAAGLRDCAAFHHRLVVDLSGLTYVDAGGLRCLAALEKAAAIRLVSLWLVVPDGHVVGQVARSVLPLTSATAASPAEILARLPPVVT